MEAKVALRSTEKGFSVSVPELPACLSQGSSEAEALETFEDAIREYVAVVARRDSSWPASVESTLS